MVYEPFEQPKRCQLERPGRSSKILAKKEKGFLVMLMLLFVRKTLVKLRVKFVCILDRIRYVLSIKNLLSSYPK